LRHNPAASKDDNDADAVHVDSPFQLAVEREPDHFDLCSQALIAAMVRLGRGPAIYARAPNLLWQINGAVFNTPIRRADNWTVAGGRVYGTTKVDQGPKACKSTPLH
jgi:hypothetical protein